MIVRVDAWYLPHPDAPMNIGPSSSLSEITDVAPSWSRRDELLIAILAIAAFVTRFWRLGYPNEPVFDELQFVGQAMAFLRGEQFTCVHPNLGPLLIACAIKVLGFHSWAWRMPGACLGAVLVPITFLLAREMFGSRLAGALAAGFVLCDGMFLIHSRLGMLEIFHLTFTAISYLMLFLILRASNPSHFRRRIIYLAVASGAAIATKLMIPEIGFVVVIGFLVYAMGLRNQGESRRVIGMILTLGSASAIVYLATFVPNYWLGWWSGAFALAHYYHEVVWQLGSFAESTNPFISPWWSWPLMLRAPLYWQTTNDLGQIATIWEGGNPVLWWSSLAALALMVVREIRHPNLTRTFLLVGYFGYMLALALPKHPFYLYIYMAPLYLQYIMLAALVSECWEGGCHYIEHLVLILSLAPACLLGLGTIIGAALLFVIVAGYAALSSRRATLAGKFVCAVIVIAAVTAFAYFLPVWIGIPLDQAGYQNRIWLNGLGLSKWM